MMSNLLLLIFGNNADFKNVLLLLKIDDACDQKLPFRTDRSMVIGVSTAIFAL